MLAQVYVLRSVSTGAFYVGSTSDLSRRLAEHQRCHSAYIRGRGPWQLVYQEEFADLRAARRRERQIKSWKSHRSIEELIGADDSG
jgi:putative endonuclease